MINVIMSMFCEIFKQELPYMTQLIDTRKK